MSENTSDRSREKPGLHPRNKHRERYDFPQLVAACPQLAPFVHVNAHNDATIDFSDPKAVKLLNKALLQHFYGVADWDIPDGYLCPPIPGRADYIHHIADLLRASHGKHIPTGSRITCLDIGVGANLVYPIIGNRAYGWSFIGADIDPAALASAKHIIAANPFLAGVIDLRLQPDSKNVFKGILGKDERIELTICNPPFHASAEAAQSGTLRKVKNLKGGKPTKPVLNFGGQSNELWCEGGEAQFVGNMITQSREFAGSCLWFSTLISKESNLKSVYRDLKKAGAAEVKTLPMGQGNKVSRIVAWTFLTGTQQEQWLRGK